MSDLLWWLIHTVLVYILVVKHSQSLSPWAPGIRASQSLCAQGLIRRTMFLQKTWQWDEKGTYYSRWVSRYESELLLSISLPWRRLKTPSVNSHDCITNNHRVCIFYSFLHPQNPKCSLGWLTDRLMVVCGYKPLWQLHGINMFVYCACVQTNCVCVCML